MSEVEKKPSKVEEKSELAVRCDSCGRALGGQRQNSEFEDGYYLLCQSCTINFRAAQANGSDIEAFIRQAGENREKKSE